MFRQPYFWVILLLSGGMFASVYFLLGQSDLPAVQPVEPAEVADGDQEIAWFNPATGLYAWTRFLAGLHFVKKQHPEWGLELDERFAAPDQSATLPAVGLRRAGARGTLWLRWYKLTGQQGSREWLELLLRRRPPPLAVVGGGSSDRARDLAVALAQANRTRPDPPLCLITTATADEVPAEGKEAELMALYPGRTFRFCFSDRQMATMILDFIGRDPALRPTEGAAYLLAWKDDPYSMDLIRQFRALLRSPAAEEASQGARPLVEVRRTWERELPYSIGPLYEPNERENAAVQALIQDLAEGDVQERALLVMPAEAKPARRVLRALFRTAPLLARRFVVTTGDSINFNVIYRDRRAVWPIQDLPCPLVLFCHRNPVLEGAGFQSEGEGRTVTDATSSGTEDLLLYGDVGAALVEAAFAEGRLVTEPEALNRRLRESKPARFDAVGNRLPGTGEFVVVLEPKWAGERVQLQANLSVYTRDAATGSWTLQRRMTVDFAPPAVAAPPTE